MFVAKFDVYLEIYISGRDSHKFLGSVQVFRKLDGLSEEIEELQPPVEQWRRFIYCSSLSGPILGTVDHMQPHGILLYLVYWLCGNSHNLYFRWLVIAN
jgi:hypothetical protein